jgi:hypothetical protein
MWRGSLSALGYSVQGAVGSDPATSAPAQSSLSSRPAACFAFLHQQNSEVLLPDTWSMSSLSSVFFVAVIALYQGSRPFFC